MLPSGSEAAAGRGLTLRKASSPLVVCAWSRWSTLGGTSCRQMDDRNLRCFRWVAPVLWVLTTTLFDVFATTLRDGPGVRQLVPVAMAIA